ncbi:hypothetical protein HMPREF9622_01383 [Cutibacterium modestum HL037PA3]|uniref:Uncharacterized protein n=1 Tax=Cutibacterium modestum HL044PA1 TaxID=765109 RepID=A0ABP2KC78_9ACTN|nr:hypothetical protein HMPREF9621_00996 [Cutibacterium modestum HL037PA2]EFS93236.1 hypothetical protein HMPREF9607_00448 [Cutibacterium modestum HL044PA1]EFT15608.1 hypothetical protein HMPREF9622_01383 [Cutibacterium modestum HL037PA3]
MLTFGNAVLEVPQMIPTTYCSRILQIAGQRSLADDNSFVCQPARQLGLGRDMLSTDQGTNTRQSCRPGRENRFVATAGQRYGLLTHIADTMIVSIHVDPAGMR